MSTGCSCGYILELQTCVGNSLTYMQYIGLVDRKINEYLVDFS